MIRTTEPYLYSYLHAKWVATGEWMRPKGDSNECREWRRDIFNGVAAGRRLLEIGHMRVARQAGYVDANRKLLAARDSLKRGGAGGVDLSWPDDQLRAWADDVARLVGRRRERYGDAEAVAWAAELCDRIGVAMPERDEAVDLFDTGVIGRVCDARWWVRQVRRLQVRELDQVARAFRLVKKGAQIYASNEAVSIIANRRARNRKTLERMEAENQFGDVWTLAELADKSTARPELRRAELMTRIAGFEHLARHLGHTCLFVTVTCPSRFHMFNGRSGAVNKRHNGETVRQAHEYLMTLWGRLRAALDRRGLHVYGFRVAEPHHDGCPHMHAMLFCQPAHVDAITALVQRYALEDSPDEPGARKVRCTVKEIDPAKGSASGYIAKYIAKSIDGAHVGHDLFGNDAEASARRICAWASTYGIRQFQQIGGPPVGVWRELRRLRDEIDAGQARDLWTEADAGDWAAFVWLMGGPICKRADRPMRCSYAATLDVDTGEILLNKYGEVRRGAVRGLLYRGVEIVTRVYEWTVRVGKGKPPTAEAFAVPRSGLVLCQ